jgi:hypothetical protein
MPRRSRIGLCIACNTARIVTGLNLCPVVFAASISKRNVRRTQFGAFYRLDPGRVSEAKSPSAFDEAVPFIMILLNDVPIVAFSRHTQTLRELCVNCVAIKKNATLQSVFTRNANDTHRKDKPYKPPHAAKQLGNNPAARQTPTRRNNRTKIAPGRRKPSHKAN